MAHVITEGRSASAAVAKAPGKAGAEEEAMVLLPAASLALLPVALVVIIGAIVYWAACVAVECAALAGDGLAGR